MASFPAIPQLMLNHALLKLDPGIVNGKAREATLARFAPVAQVKIRP